MKHKMAECIENLTDENTIEIQTSSRPDYKAEKINQETTDTKRMYKEKSLGLPQDEYEKEFERIMLEQENEHGSNESDKSVSLNSTRMRGKSQILNEHEDNTRQDPNSHGPEPTKVVQTISIAKPCSITRHADKYPSELNPFGDDERQGSSTNPFGDSDEEESHHNVKHGHGTNPFGDSDEEESSHKGTTPHPQPIPRRSISTARPWKEEPDNSRLKLPVPLPRTLSKSMPSTPNQSPLLHANRSFRLPGSSSSFTGSNISAYNSIRRKKKPAPPPPNNFLSTPSVLPQSQTISTKPNNRPRKSRMAPLPPSLTAPGIGKLQSEISSLSLQDAKK